jgi:leucyl aminopeptidase
MEIKTTKALKTDSDLLILGLFEEDKQYYSSLNKELSIELKDAINKKRFKASFARGYSTKINKTKITILGLGKKEEFTLEKLRELMGLCVKITKCKKLTNFSTNIPSLSKENKKLVGMATAEGIYLGNYHFDKYISEDKENPKIHIKTVYLNLSNDGLKEGKIIAEATNLSRDLINEPPITATPTYIEKQVKDLVKKHKNLSLKVLNESEMKKLGMNALLGVSAGSDQAPKLLFIEYKGGTGKPIALVGKGITFDAGGYNLKPSRAIAGMKADMSGAAAVIGTMKAIAELKPKKNIIGVTPLCENLVNGKAYKPDDILRAYNGKTIEIGNTDAEGRLILADSLAYTDEKYKPEVMIDLATLTGACVVALGEKMAGLFSKDKELATELQLASEKSGDLAWELPLRDIYMDAMKGSISDLKNIAPSNYGAGATTAAVFLSHFVENARWAHLDIAGTAFISDDRHYLKKGGTGAGVRLLSYFLTQ